MASKRRQSQRLLHSQSSEELIVSSVSATKKSLRKNDSLAKREETDTEDFGKKQKSSLQENESKQKRLNLKGDRLNILLLLLLYTLQGVPMGLSSSVAFTLTERGASFADQGVFSLASWPFSMKILWAPIVDALYFKKFGQRRTWLMPLQIIVGLSLLVLSGNLEQMIDDGAKHGEVQKLALAFFAIYFMLATQDIAVDGWAITMLKRENVGLASTCNAVGQTFGFFASFTGFLVLNAREYCDLAQFVKFWAIVFLISSVAVFLKSEDEVKEEDVASVKETYRQGLKVISLPNVKSLAVILLTRHVAFSPAESLTQLKLLEKGVPKTFLASMNALIAPLNILMPMISAKWTAGARPLHAVSNTFVYRGVACALASIVVIAWTKLEGADDSIKASNIFFSALVLVWMCLSSALATVQFVGVMSFFSKVSDESIGGTYMTLLNTLSNLGSKVAETFVLFFVDFVSEKKCSGASSSKITACTSNKERDTCIAAGGKCHLDDGHYHAFVLISPVLALLWVLWQSKRISKLSLASIDEWRLTPQSNKKV